MNSSDDQDRVSDEEEMALIGDESLSFYSHSSLPLRRNSVDLPLIYVVLYIKGPSFRENDGSTSTDDKTTSVCLPLASTFMDEKIMSPTEPKPNTISSFRLGSHKIWGK